MIMSSHDDKMINMFMLLSFIKHRTTTNITDQVININICMFNVKNISTSTTLSNTFTYLFVVLLLNGCNDNEIDNKTTTAIPKKNNDTTRCIVDNDVCDLWT